jgi:hypothetical protein
MNRNRIQSTAKPFHALAAHQHVDSIFARHRRNVVGVRQFRSRTTANTSRMADAASDASMVPMALAAGMLLDRSAQAARKYCRSLATPSSRRRRSRFPALRQKAVYRQRSRAS